MLISCGGNRNSLRSIAMFVRGVAFNTDKGKPLLVSFDLGFALSEFPAKL